MKRTLLVFASLLIGLTTATATELNNSKPKIKLEKKKKHHYTQPILFMERGVEFLIFPDGSFDFNTSIDNNHYDDTYYRSNSKRSNVNTNRRGPNSNIKYNSNRYPNRGVSISRDRNGTVRRIGNVYLNYDKSGRVNRVGSIFMSYNRGRNSDLSRVGGLQVNYNRWGEITNTHGQVNRSSRDYCNFCGVNSCRITHDFENNEGNGHRNHNNDDAYYYFKQNGKVKKHIKSKKNKR